MPDFLFHPVCEMFPLIEGEEFDQFVASIRENGLQVPVLIHEGLICDGRIRYLACREAGVECRFVEWDGRGCLPLIIASRNIHGRHLTVDQRAAIGLRVLKFIAAEAKKNQLATLKRGTQIPVLANLPKREETPEKRVSDKTRAQMRAILRQNGEEEIERKLQLHCPGIIRRDVSRGAAEDAILDRMFGPEKKGPVPIHARDVAAKSVYVSSRKMADLIVIDREAPHLIAPMIAGDVKSAEALRQVHNNRRQEKLAAAGVAAAGVAAAGVAAPYELVKDECTARLYREKAHVFRLAIADPPYNEGIDYGCGAKADKLPKEKYLAFTRAWIEEVHRTLTNDGALWIIISDAWAHHALLIAEQAGFTLRRWCKWYESFGTNCSDNFTKSSRHLLYLVKNESDYVFHPEAVTRESWRQRNGDPRANPAGRLWDDVWGIDPPIPRLVGNARERVSDFPTQLPVALVRPMIEVCSEPGDRILDPFNGSGTTGAATLAAGRHRKYLGIDISQKYIDLARIRLAGVDCTPTSPTPSNGANRHERETQPEPSAQNAAPARRVRTPAKAPAATARRPKGRR